MPPPLRIGSGIDLEVADLLGATAEPIVPWVAFNEDIDETSLDDHAIWVVSRNGLHETTTFVRSWEPGPWEWEDGRGAVEWADFIVGASPDLSLWVHGPAPVREPKVRRVGLDWEEVIICFTSEARGIGYFFARLRLGEKE